MKKIMFNDRYGLTKAVIDGRKTMTRRMIKAPKRINGQYVNGFIVCTDIATHEVTGVYARDYNGASIEDREILPKYKIGEIVAVAQSYCSIADELENCNNATCVSHYAKNVQKASEYISWMEHPGFNNKMFVNPELMPHQIRITGTRIERLQDISDEDCLREGVRYFPDLDPYYPDLCLYYYVDKEQGFYFNSPREAFAALIDKVSGAGTWDSNPFVVVYEFELVK